MSPKIPKSLKLSLRGSVEIQFFVNIVFCVLSLSLSLCAYLVSYLPYPGSSSERDYCVEANVKTEIREKEDAGLA